MFGQSSGTGSAFGGFGASNANNNPTSLFGSSVTSTGPAFGSNTATSSTSAFGQSSGFGSTSTTGSGLFGQNTNQSSGFGGFGNASRPTFGSSSTGFGGSGGLFGSSNTTQNTTSTFGSGGGFGSNTNAAANTSPFGQTNTASTGTGLFGSAAKPASAFGGFGSTNTNTGTTNTGFGSGFGASVGTTNQGTTIPFEPVQEKEASSNVTNVFQSISCMPAYQKFSFEELREQDYAQGRRYGNPSGAGAFGKSTGFGTGTFGQSNTFGQPSSSTGGAGLFGSSTSQPSTFGSSASGFGSNTSNTSGGLFGQKPASGGLFGSTSTTNNAGTGGLFGGTSNTGGFGSNAPSAFGQTNTNAFGSTSAFGQGNATQNKPAFGTGFGGFGSTNTATSSAPAFGTNTPAFGSSTTNTGTGLFGNAPSNATTSSFGQPAATGTSGFGGLGMTSNTASSQPQAFGGFGGTASTQNKPAFGTGFGSTSNSQTTTPSLFGQQQNQQNKPLFGGGFGQTQTQQPAAGGGLFGTSAPQTGTSLFSTTNTAAGGTGLFGSTGAGQQSNGQAGGLFGAKPQTSLFGNNQSQNTGTSLFGGNTATTGGFGTQTGASLFGSSTQPQTGSLFGSSQMGGIGAQQAPLQASIDQNPFGSNPLFSYVNQPVTSSPGPIATPISSSSAQKKKPAMLPTYKLSPRPPSSPRPKSASTRSVSGGPSASAPALSSSRSLLFDGIADQAILSSEAFSPRNDIRKLVIDRKVTESDILSGGADLSKYHETPQKDQEKHVAFSDTKQMKERSATSLPTSATTAILKGSISDSDVPPAEPLSTPKPAIISTEKPKPNPPSTVQDATVLGSASGSSPVVENDGYWSSPSASVLRKMSLKELESVANYKVGRKGYGEVSFNRPVDLSAFAHPEQIPGQLILFGPKTCTVYPDDSIKPEQGKGLNVPATITLEKCYPVAKDTKQPITEVDHPLVPVHIERLRKMKDTHFITYIAESGTWVFSIDHFSIWGLLDDEDEYEAHAEPVKLPPPASVASQPLPAFQFAQSQSQILDYSPMKTDQILQQTPQHMQDVSMASSEYDSGRRRLPGDWNVDSSYDFKPEDTPLRRKSYLGHGGTFQSREEVPAFEVKSPMVAGISASQVYSEDDEVISDEEKEESYIEEVAPQPRSITDDEIVSIEGSRVIDQYEGEEDMDSSFAVPIGRNWLEQLKLARAGRSMWAVVDDKKNEIMAHTEQVSRLEEYKFTFADLDAELFGGESFFGRGSGQKSDLSLAASPSGTSPKFSADGKIYVAMGNKLSTKEIDSFIVDSSKNFDFLRVYLSSSTAVLRDGELPLFKPSSSLSFGDILDFYLCSTNADQSVIDVWKLACILFDDPALDMESLNPDADKEIAVELLRKARLSAFFENLVEKDVAKSLCRLPREETVFTLLSGHQIEQACIEAVKDKNLHLATLIPLIGGDADFRRDIKNQINDWATRNVLSEVPTSIRKVYELLSGNTSLAKGSVRGFSEDKVPEFCVSKGLDWRRAFGLRLWYEIHEEDNIEKAVKKYEMAFENLTDVQSPSPSHIDTKSPVDNSKRDILFELLKLYADFSHPVELAVLPSSISSLPLNFAVSWQLFNILFRTKRIREVNDESLAAYDKSCADFAWQLESAGRWKDASFVLLHIDDSVIARQSVQELLNRHVPDIQEASENEEYLLKVLRIPQVMILHAKALYARYTHDSVKEAQYLLDASEWNEAHSVIIRTVGPKAVISESLDDLLALLSRFKDVTGISNWKVGGQVYLDYINVLKTATEENVDLWWPKHIRGLPVQGISLGDSLERLRSSLRLIDYASLGFMSMVAVREMAKIAGVDV
ncbi:nuclear protein 96-domain-containing protein [Lipomyces tetrasporus]|uniref:Nuclear protein 96-domain-containing protein n=1 Tax=Lipomyces tetrasporus TaxID=54092 RepID=A0AAD7VTJ8_9ASCO|nr:nuclear protein 96-domain-containing protein [Lipomyces tetrasporus]KAJ8101543.1 nuclear protein 96-domain-containing protein [Lipomyces tetrasporus]